LEPQVNQIKEYIDSVKRAAKEIERREKIRKSKKKKK
jgi:hypothetical protein